MGTIGDQPALPSGSLATPAQVLLLVEDQSNGTPYTANNLSLDRLSDFPPTELAPGSPITLAGTEQFEIFVDSNDVANTVTVPPSQKCRISNTSQTSDNLVVITTGNSDQTLIPGETLTVLWDGSAHDITKTCASGTGVTVDSAMSGASANPVQNQVVKAYVDNRNLVRPEDQIVTGSGVTATDATALATAVSALNAAVATGVHGTLWIDGEVRVDTFYEFDGVNHLRGIDSNASILAINATAEFVWGAWFDARLSGALTGSPVAVDLLPVAAFDNAIDSPNLDLDIGDWFVVYSTDVLLGMYPHLTYQHPMEMHTVVRRELLTPTADSSSATFTFAAATSDICTATAHGLADTTVVRLTTSGTLPGGLASGTDYFIRDATTDTFKLALTSGGTAVDITSTGSGTHTVTSGDVFLATSHKLVNGSKVVFSTTGTLPGGISGATDYYVVNKTTNRFQVATTPGGAAVNLTSNGSGTLTATTSRYVLADFIVDALTVSPLIRRINIVAAPGSTNATGLLIDNLRVRQSLQAGGSGSDRLFDIRRCNGVRFERVHYDTKGSDTTVGDGAGHMHFTYAANIVVDGVQIDGVEDYRESTGSLYGIEFGAVNGAIVQNGFFRKCRHAIDTTASSSDVGAGRRWGTPRNVLATNNVFHGEGHAGSSLLMTSTHAEGWGVTFDANVFVMSDLVTNGCGTYRARRTIFTNNIVHGSGTSKGVILNADDCVVSGNTFYNTWRAVTIDTSYVSHGWDNTLITCNTLQDSIGSDGSITLSGDNNVCTHNTFTNHGQGCVRVNGDYNVVDHNVMIGCGSTGYAPINLESGDYNSASHNAITRSVGPAIIVETGDYAKVLSNTFTSCSTGGNYSIVDFQGTGANSSEFSTVACNVFTACPDVCIEFTGGASGVGDGQQVRGNTFISCGGSGDALIKFADDGTTTGHVVSGNDAPLGTQSYFIDCGALDSAAIKIRGNQAWGYGSSSLGLTGTNAAALYTSESAFNVISA